MLNDTSEKLKAKCCMIHLYMKSKCKTQRRENRMVPGTGGNGKFTKDTKLFVR